MKTFLKAKMSFFFKFQIVHPCSKEVNVMIDGNLYKITDKGLELVLVKGDATGHYIMLALLFSAILIWVDIYRSILLLKVNGESRPFQAVFTILYVWYHLISLVCFFLLVSDLCFYKVIDLLLGSSTLGHVNVQVVIVSKDLVTGTAAS